MYCPLHPNNRIVLHVGGEKIVGAFCVNEVGEHCFTKEALEIITEMSEVQEDFLEKKEKLQREFVHRAAHLHVKLTRLIAREMLEKDNVYQNNNKATTNNT